MPKSKASRRNKFNHWDDELDEFHSSGKDERKAKTGIHTNRREHSKSKLVNPELGLPPGEQVNWLVPRPASLAAGTSEVEPGYPANKETSLSLAEIRELADRLKQLSEQTAHKMHNVRACGIDFGPDMDRQFSLLMTKRTELEGQIQQQTHLYNQESSRLQQSLGGEAVQVIAEMIRFENKKQTTYQGLYRQFKKLFSELQAFHEGVEGLAWNLDQCN